METIEELQEFINSVLRSKIRKNLLAQGKARASIRRQGQLPDSAPAFATDLDTKLLEYALSLLRASLALRESQDGNREVYQKGFLKAGNAFESLVQNGSHDVTQHGFCRVMGAASYHLAGYAAMAFSLVKGKKEVNLAPAERVIVRLLVSDLQSLRQEAETWLKNPEHRDERILVILKEGERDTDEVFSIILTTSIYRAFAFFEFALLTGDKKMYEQAMFILRHSLHVASGVGAVSMWWLIRIATNLIDNLWSNSLHQIIPLDGPKDADNYSNLREMFLASLYSRKISAVELWPSQINAAKRAVNLIDHLVVSLPTSAGKTRIAEICTLMCLSVKGKRVLFITPLRALSAQTERTFRETFTPLGFSVSSLYGASGAPPDDQDALRSQDIVIATPEKLDFAMRSDPQIIDNVGLIVLDEGHMIGPGERELRYEVLVQKLLRRKDAGERRIVCLSAILPSGEQLDDFNAWIRNNVKGEAVRSNWRPTRQRFGTLTWKGQSARLTFDFDDSESFIPNFVREHPAIPPRRTPFPKNNIELTFAAAWNFAKEGKRTLIFCTQRNHVESYAKKIIDLSERGFIPSLLENRDSVERAKSIGFEWLGYDHPAVQCLDLGVAIHHARLPKPFLREIERLLSKEILTVTVASPTLAQGLNLNAAVLLVPNLYRASDLLTGEEFANVAGRAGRAFVDLEGLVIHVMFEPEHWRQNEWHNLVKSSSARKLESGLIQVANEILQRLADNERLDREDAFEYLANNRDAWNIEDSEEDNDSFEVLREKLDHVILGLIESLDADTTDLPQLIDECLEGSLWARQIARRGGELRERQIDLLRSRSRLIWSHTTAQSRRGHFAMGVGLDAGLILDTMAEELATSLDRADMAALQGDTDSLLANLINLAEQLLFVRPFKPDDSLPTNWRDLLSKWVSGTPINEIEQESTGFVEDVFSYRLVWAIEALRTRRIAFGWQPETVAGTAAACLDVGLPQYRMAILVRSGLPSRKAAMAAVNDQNPIIIDYKSLKSWLGSDAITSLTDSGNWPTSDTSGVWIAFRNEMLDRTSRRWNLEEWRQSVELTQPTPRTGCFYRVDVDEAKGTVSVLTPDFNPVAIMRHKMVNPIPSVLTARFEKDNDQVTFRRLGSSHASWSE